MPASKLFARNAFAARLAVPDERTVLKPTGQTCLHLGNLGKLKRTASEGGYRDFSRDYYRVLLPSLLCCPAPSHGLQTSHASSTAINQSIKLWYALARGSPYFFSGVPKTD